MVGNNEQGTKRAGRVRSGFRQIAKGDLVTIHDAAGERKGHATKREYGDWVLVLERNKGTALATKENTVAVSKPKKLAQPPRVGQRLVYDDGRRRTGKVVEVDAQSMRVLFDNRAEPSLIHYDDPEWIDYVSFEMPSYEPGDYVKFEMKDEKTGESEWLWLAVDSVDSSKQVVLGRLDSQPVAFSAQ